MVLLIDKQFLPTQKNKGQLLKMKGGQFMEKGTRTAFNVLSLA